MIEELKKLAMDAGETYPGKWEVCSSGAETDGKPSGVRVNGKMSYDNHIVFPYIPYEDAGTCIPEYIAAWNPATALKMIAVVEAAKALRYRNKFDGTWVEANDWETMRDALQALESEPK